jgi:hypothetical protein
MRKLTILLVCLAFIFLLAPAASADDWRAEFDEICSKVELAESLSLEELNALVERADELLPKIQSSDNPQKKVYIFRLKKCRNFLNYIIELKEGG